MRIYYIFGIVMSIILPIVITFISVEYNAAYWNNYFRSEDLWDSGSSYYGYGGDDVDFYYGMYAAVCVFMLLFFMLGDILGLVLVKTTTAKVMGIIGLSVSFIMMCAFIISMVAEEIRDFFPAWWIYGVFCLAFSIVGLVQAIIWHNRKNQAQYYNMPPMFPQ